MKKLSLLIIGIILMPMLSYSQKHTSIESIQNNPGIYHQEHVSIEGIVISYERAHTTTTFFYRIRDDYDNHTISVYTNQGSPDILSRYRVEGYVTSDHRGLAISETNRRKISSGERPPPPPPPDSQNNTTLIAILVIGLIVIGGGIIYFLTRPKPQPAFMQEPGGVFDQPSMGAPPMPEPGGAATVVMNKGEDYQTIKFEPSVPPTMKFIPGKLEILNGPDKGKTLMLAGYPTQDGSMASIGRDHQDWENQSGLSGGRKFAHVRIKDDSRTLSRMQAEILYRNGKIYLKNLSSVNPSQVDGYNVPVNEVAEVKPGSKITTGFIEFRYQQK